MNGDTDVGARVWRTVWMEGAVVAAVAAEGVVVVTAAESETRILIYAAERTTWRNDLY